MKVLVYCVNEAGHRLEKPGSVAEELVSKKVPGPLGNVLLSYSNELFMSSDLQIK